jgi:tartrate dehydratase alpha subunit/fumarate hydratase class I-like protein
MDSIKDIRKTDLAAILNEITEGATDKATTSWASQIKAEYQRLAEDENHLHNQLLHKQILQDWKTASPHMVKTLELTGILDQTAFVMQARMFQEMDELIAQGMPVTDAREQAEKNHLMLEAQC